MHDKVLIENASEYPKKYVVNVHKLNIRTYLAYRIKLQPQKQLEKYLAFIYIYNSKSTCSSDILFGTVSNSVFSKYIP